MRKVRNRETKQEKKTPPYAPQLSSSVKDKLIIVLVIIILSTAGFSGFYIWKAKQYQQVFLLNTYINGIDVSGKTVEEVKVLINSGIEGYQLEISGKGGEHEILIGEAINLHSEFDGSLEQILDKQNPYAWGFRFFNENRYQIETMIAFDPQLLEKALENMKLLDPESAVWPEDAYLSDYISGQGYEIIPEQEGTLVDWEISEEGIRAALLNLQTGISLEDLNAYIAPAVCSTDEQLTAKRESRNRYVNVIITHQFGDKNEVLDGETTHMWITFDEADNITIDQTAVADYVAGLAKNYNTAYTPKTLKTSYGDSVTITGGNYGWRINQSAEAAAICEIIRSGESQTREPIYSQTAASHGDIDYGDTYVEINLTAQHLFFYKNGALVIESDFVSGNESKGWGTPAGAYPLTYKQRNATLKGEGYSTPVDYWMPFNGGIGMHDAGWRSSFGGNIYKTGGSHGCINLPPTVAKTIYENISAGVPVLCYLLKGTAGSGTTTLVPQETTAPATEPALPVTSESPEPTETAPETSPEPTAQSSEAAAESETQLPVITPPGSETTAAETTPSEPAATTPAETEEQPIVGPGGVQRETEAEVGPGVYQ